MLMLNFTSPKLTFPINLLHGYRSALGPSTSGGTFTTPLSIAALTASISGPEFVLCINETAFPSRAGMKCKGP